MPPTLRSRPPGSEKDQNKSQNPGSDQNKSQNKKDIQKKRTLEIQNENQESEAPKGKKQKFCNAPPLAPEQHESSSDHLSDDEEAPNSGDETIAQTVMKKVCKCITVGT
jgi:hypothetical protein